MAPSTRSTKRGKGKSPSLAKPKSTIKTAQTPNKVSKVTKPLTTKARKVKNDDNGSVRDQLSNSKTKPKKVTKSPKRPNPLGHKSKATSGTLAAAKEQSEPSPLKHDLPSPVKRAEAAGKMTTFKDPFDWVHFQGGTDQMRASLKYKGKLPEDPIHEHYFLKEKLQERDRKKFPLSISNRKLMAEDTSGNTLDYIFCLREIDRIREKLKWKGQLPYDVVHQYLFLKERDEERERKRAQFTDQVYKKAGKEKQSINVPHGLKGDDLLRENETLRKELGWTGEMPEDPVHEYIYLTAGFEGREAAVAALTHQQPPSKKSSTSSFNSLGSLDNVIAENEAMLDELRWTKNISTLPDHPLEQNYILKEKIKEKSSSSSNSAVPEPRNPPSFSPHEAALTSSSLYTQMRKGKRPAPPRRTVSNMSVAGSAAPPQPGDASSPATPTAPSLTPPSTPGVPLVFRSTRSTKSKAPAKVKIVAPTRRRANQVREAYLLIQDNLQGLQEEMDDVSRQLRVSNAAVRDLGGRFKYMQGVIGKALDGVDWEGAE